MLPAYFGCYTDAVFGNNTWFGNTKNEASVSITSQEMIQPNSNVVYDAGSRVVLSPGFRALQGSKFHAYINGCGGAAPGIGNNTKEDASAPITFESSKAAPSTLEAVPNPATSAVVLRFNLEHSESNVVLEAHDASGRVVKQTLLNYLNAGKQNIRFNLADLPSGVYNIMLRFNSGKGLSTNVVLSK
jgi:hypothetical protein